MYLFPHNEQYLRNLTNVIIIGDCGPKHSVVYILAYKYFQIGQACLKDSHRRYGYNFPLKKYFIRCLLIRFWSVAVRNLKYLAPIVN
jgi:hypothetical protein